MTGLDAAAVERAFDALASADGLTRRTTTFSRRDVVQALAERLPPAALDAAALEAAADRFLASSRVVALLPEGGGEAFRRRDGRLLPAIREELAYSTPELLAIEQRLVQSVDATRSAGAGVAAEGDVANAVAARPTLSPEQRAMIDHVCLDGDGVAVVVGKAGTGKTFALDAAREAWQAAGHPVLGVAVARRAARELQDGAGIATTSVAALLADGRTRSSTALPQRCVLVVDEAGMVPTRELAAMVDAVSAVDGKLVLVGDHRQLPELGAGGAFRGMVNRGLAIELTENRRQVHAWERRALDHMREGRSDQGLELYRAHGRLAFERTPDQVRERLVDDWLGAGDPEQAVMIAPRRVEVADLNARARDRLRVAGALGDAEIELPGGRFAVGDLVVVKRNDARLGVVNGTAGGWSASTSRRSV